ncbi:hypothetical protein [Nocardioides sp. Leaf285]|uniref:hypothetical protein n=1 Tax=Nocardioides sp. Leaf285 TaxID=1736322 RepID=UPI000702654C|nr:hypothetical protein [Nocardioides sp. Leaf285]KQP62884.1 hypothetical protein ASF47_17890 [Nocardioides sp. Leaf285]
MPTTTSPAASPATSPATRTRPTPTRKHAQGMLAGIQAQRAAEGHPAEPVSLLDLDSASDRRIISSLYAMMARPAAEQMAQRSR